MADTIDIPPFVTEATAAILARARAAAPVDYAAMGMDAARALFETNNRSWNEPIVPVDEVCDFHLPVRSGAVRARLYRPRRDPRLPVVLYVHGGGWTFGSVDSHDRCMRLLAERSGAAVLGIDYRLAPEHPFPAGLEDVLDALDWLTRDGAHQGLEPTRIALAGDSAGANIALAALLDRRDRHGGMPAGAALFYGCYAPIFDTGSHRRFGNGDYVLSTARMRWYWGNYLGTLPMDTTGLAAPLRADLRGLPRLYLNAAGLDPLLDDTLLMSQRLAHAGTACELDLMPGVLHGCMQQTREEPVAAAGLVRAARYLAGVLAG
jgi:acetyl esterase